MSVASNFCCDETEPRTLHTPLISRLEIPRDHGKWSMNDARDGLICVRLRCRERRPTWFTREQPLPHLRALSCITKETSLPDEPSTNSDLRVLKKQELTCFLDKYNLQKTWQWWRWREWVGMMERRELVQALAREGNCHPRCHLDELGGRCFFFFCI